MHLDGYDFLPHLTGRAESGPRRDPYERADTDSNMYNEWWVDRVPRLVQAREVIALFLGSLRQYPPRQRPASFTIDQIFENVTRQLAAQTR